MELKRANRSMDIVIHRGKIYPAMLLGSSAALSKEIFTLLCFSLFLLLLSLSIYTHTHTHLPLFFHHPSDRPGGSWT